MSASRGKLIFVSILFAAAVCWRGALSDSVNIAHRKVPLKTYTGYGMPVSDIFTTPLPLSMSHVSVLTIGNKNAQTNPKAVCLYCALMSRTASLYASGLALPMSFRIDAHSSRGLLIAEAEEYTLVSIHFLMWYFTLKFAANLCQRYQRPTWCRIFCNLQSTLQRILVAVCSRVFIFETSFVRRISYQKRIIFLVDRLLLCL